MRRLMAGMVMTAMAGCATAAEEVPVRGETGRKCDASKAQGLVGRMASEALGAEALRLSGAGKLRWIAPGMAVTMDFREDRLNIRLDGRNMVTAITCG